MGNPAIKRDGSLDSQDAARQTPQTRTGDFVRFLTFGLLLVGTLPLDDGRERNLVQVQAAVLVDGKACLDVLGIEKEE